MPSNIYRTTPLLSKKTLNLPPEVAPEHERVISVDSQAWFQWLTSECRFAYQLHVKGQRRYTITFRAEKKQRGGSYWSAYMTDQLGKLHKLYVGTADNLTWERLTEIIEAMRDKLALNEAQELSYPTAKMQPPRAKPSQPTLTAQDVAPIKRYDDLLTLCSAAFAGRWGRAWQWDNGKIYRNTFNHYYYVMDQTGERKHILGNKRYFVVLQLLHWVNHGYDEGYNDKLPNA